MAEQLCSAKYPSTTRCGKIRCTTMVNQRDERPRRGYEKRRRAASEAETRQRITEAAMTLHGTVGPAHTTIKGIAAEAGVQRATVYRHFPDLESLFVACSTHWASLNPPPDPQEWSQVKDPDIRLSQALSELYAWYDWAEPMLINVFRDASSVPAMARPMEHFQLLSQALHQALMAGRTASGRGRAREAAVIAHALSFTIWRSLVREHELHRSEVIELMRILIDAAPSVG